MGEILICGQRYQVNSRVLNFADGGFSFADTTTVDGEPLLRQRPGRPQDVDELSEIINKIVIHHDGCPDPATCFQVLVERELSTHFMIARDGLIYQAADPVMAAIHAGFVNATSIGIDMSNPADNLLETPDATGPAGAEPSKVLGINGVEFSSWTYSQAQYDSLNELAGLLGEVLDIPSDMPVGQDGGVMLDAMGRDAATSFEGVMCHWHLDAEKWDPGPGFDFVQFHPPMAWQGAVLPVEPELGDCPGYTALATGRAAAGICSAIKRAAPTDALSLLDAFGEAVDGSIDGGWFPIGVNGNWHGGIHIPCQAGAEVRPVAAGEIVAASFGNGSDEDERRLGSSGFVLVRHTHRALPGGKTWYSLYMHLQRPNRSAFDRHPLVMLLARSDATRSSGSTAVTGSQGLLPEALDPAVFPDQIAAVKVGRVGLFSDPGSRRVAVGPHDVIGYVAPAGAVHGRSQAVLHFEVFRNPDETDFPGGERDAGRAMSGVAAAEDDACGAAAVISGLIVDRSPDLTPDTDSDAKAACLVARAAVARDGHTAAGRSLREVSVLHMSEWSPDVDWLAAMRKSAATRNIAASEAAEGVFVGYLSSYARFAWQNAAVCTHAGLNQDGFVVSVNPLWFMFACLRVTLPGDLWKGREKALGKTYRGRSLISRIIDIWSV